MPKILLFDIETSPNLGYVWGKWEQNVIENVSDWYILSFSWKWLGEKNTHVLGLSSFKGYKKDPENDKELVATLRELFDEADLIVAHNGDQFDIRKVNARMLVHGMPPPSPYKTIDTLKVARKYFKFDSNKLDELARHLKIGHKAETGGFALWKGCMAGNKKSWKTMLEYNKQDVILLEKVYLKLRSWVTNFPMIGQSKRVCPNCEAHKLQSRGFRFTKTQKIQRLQCTNCGGWSDGLREKHTGAI